MSNPHNVEPDPLSDMGEDTPTPGLDRDDVVEDLRDGWRKAAAKRDELQEKLEALKFCPFCATAFEPPPGWLHDRCPGCRRAEWAQAERDEWKRGAETYGRELAESESKIDRLRANERHLRNLHDHRAKGELEAKDEIARLRENERLHARALATAIRRAERAEAEIVWLNEQLHYYNLTADELVKVKAECDRLRVELAAEQEENDRLKGEHDEAVQRLASSSEQLRTTQHQLQELASAEEERRQSAIEERTRGDD